MPQVTENDAERAEYLRKLSQCVYNLIKIIDTHFTEPIKEDKELNLFYLDEIGKLNELLNVPIGSAVVSPGDVVLAKNLIFTKSRTRQAQEQIDNADDCLSIALGKIQFERKYGLTRPTTGLEEGQLKDYLKKIQAGKHEQNNETKKLRVEIVGSSQLTQVTANRLIGGLIQDLLVGQLRYSRDGSIYYKQTNLDMRFQLRTLCVLFMDNHQNFLDYSRIKDELISAKKRSTIDFKTITKYVSELHIILKGHFRRKVIFNQGKEGYIFDIERDS